MGNIFYSIISINSDSAHTKKIRKHLYLNSVFYVKYSAQLKVTQPT